MTIQIDINTLLEHYEYFSKFLPFVITGLFANFVILLGGIYLLRVLRRHLSGWFWRSRAATVIVPVATVWGANTFMSELFVLLPAVAGVATGWALRRRFEAASRPFRLAIALAAGIATLGLAGALLRVARVGLWDALTMLLALGLGYAAGCWWERREFPWGGVALAGVSLGVSLVIAELLARIFLPVLPKYYSEHPTAIRFPQFDLHRVAAVPQTPFDIPFDFTLCGELFEDDTHQWPAAFPQFFGAQEAVPARAVLHLGDSLTQGRVADEGAPFPELLEPATPGVRQINLGQGGTEPDFYYLIARKWVPRLPIELVIVHVFLGNDIWELGKPFRCCNDGPLLARAGAQVEPRCAQAQWADGFGDTFAWFVANSPPPSIVRRFTPTSQSARYLVAAMMRLQRQRFGAPKLYASDILTDMGGNAGPETHDLQWLADSQDDQWVMFEAILRTLRDEMAARQVALIVSLLPVTHDLQNGTWQGANSSRVRALTILDRLQIETLDPWAPFAAVVKQDGPDAVFLPHGDAHFNASGHRLYTNWLLEKLGPRLGAAASTASVPPANAD